ncbi:hypothetical protein Tco_1361113 [Tanacetum coccineum]
MEPAMEEYMTNTQEDYGWGITRPKIDDKAHFKLKGQFLKELRDNTFSGSDNEDANEHIEKFLEIEVILFYKGLNVPTRQILDSEGVIPSMKAADAKKAIQDMADHSQKWHNGMSTRTRRGIYRAAAPGFYQRDNGNPSYQERRKTMEESLSKFMAESAKRHNENSNLIKEIRASTDAAIRNQGASIKALEIQIGQMSKVLQERGSGSLPGSTEKNSRDHVKSISTTVEADTTSIHRIGTTRYAVSSP